MLVSPHYHRVHHAIGIGHEGAGPGTLGGCNFAVLFPLWDILGGTARFDRLARPSRPPASATSSKGRDYGRGFGPSGWACVAWRDRRAGLPTARAARPTTRGLTLIRGFGPRGKLH